MTKADGADLLDSLSVGFFRSAPDGRLLHANQALADMLGYPSVEALKAVRVPEIWLDPRDRQQLIDRLGREGLVRDFEMRLRRHDGGILWVRNSVREMRDAAGEVYFEGAIHDVTDRKRTEESLRESEAKYRRLVETSTDVIWTVGIDGQIEFINEAAITVFGYEPRELVGRSFLDFVVDPERDLMSFERVLAGETVLGHECQVYRRDGRTIWISSSASLCRDEGRRWIGISGQSRDITDRKLAEAERDRFFNLTRDLVAVIGRDGRLRRVNPAWPTALGYAADSVVERPLEDFLHPEDRAKLAIALDRVAGGAESSGFELRFLCADGSTRWFLWNLVASPGEGAIYGSGRDISERRRSERMLRESEVEYRLLFAANPHPMWVHDRETLRFLAVNDAALHHYGFTRDEFLALTIRDVLAPGEHTGFDEAGGAADAFAVSGLRRHRKKDGTLTDVELSSHSTVFAGRSARLVLANDVTEKLRADRFLRDRTRLAQYSREIAVIVSESGDLPALLRRCCESTVVSLDAVAARVWTLDECGDALELQASAGLEDADPRLARVPLGKLDVGRIAAERRPLLTNALGTDPRMTDADWARQAGCQAFAGYPLVVGERLVGVLGVFSRRAFSEATMDVLAPVAHAIALGIERKGSEEALRTALKKAEESAQLKSSFLANMSHEIRTPLNVILGYSSLIAEHLHDRGDTSQDPLFDNLSNSSKRLLETINNILDLSKIETGGFELHVKRVVLAATVERIVRDFQPLARAKSLDLEVEIDDRTCTAWFDEYCLTQAVTNLVGNAIKFTERGAVTVKLYRDAEGLACLDVRDTGVGIDARFLGQLFQPFQQEESGYTRRFEGTGLGLALVKNYVHLNGASIDVTSEKGKGTVFTVHFGQSWSDARTPAGESSARGKKSVWRRTTVLVVEDDDATQEYMRVVLGRHHEVLVASGGEELRRQLAAHGSRIAVVLMDLSLKGDEDGLELTRQLRAEPRNADLGIIAVTAHAFPEDRERALASGCDAYLAKPVDHVALLRKIEELLLRRKPAAEPPASPPRHLSLVS